MKTGIKPQKKTEEESKNLKANTKVGVRLLLISIGIFLLNYFFIDSTTFNKATFNLVKLCHSFFSLAGILVLFIAIYKLFDFSGILFDNEEYVPNANPKELVEKIRYRGVLFNNIAIIIFLFTILVILISFYLIVDPHSAAVQGKSATAADSQNDLVSGLTIRISASVLLIFLVQILFKVFKYLLRVAAFYNARADAIECKSFAELKNEGKLGELMDLFTPEKYDISEVEQQSILGSLIEATKTKFGK
jgi:hypothetical protein